MKVEKETFARWNKYTDLFLKENGITVAAVNTPIKAWDVAHRLSIPKEAYHIGLNDSHIKTALRKLFPHAWN